MHHIQLNDNIPKNWKVFLAHQENKESLARCIAEFIKLEGFSSLRDEQLLVVGGGNHFSTFQVSSSGVADVPELDSNQEEADSRMILHLQHSANKGLTKAAVNTPDTDVLLLLIHHSSAISCEQIIC